MTRTSDPLHWPRTTDGGVPLASQQIAGLPLLEPLARRTDPDTSHRAAHSMRQGAAAQRQTILRLLTAHADGLTNDELDRLAQWRTGSASRRVVELIRLGLVTRLSTTRATVGGRAAHVHILGPHPCDP